VVALFFHFNRKDVNSFGCVFKGFCMKSHWGIARALFRKEIASVVLPFLQRTTEPTKPSSNAKAINMGIDTTAKICDVSA
jgi:hypothetical protein